MMKDRGLDRQPPSLCPLGIITFSAENELVEM